VNLPLGFNDQAAVELFEAVDYYAMISDELGTAFLDEVTSACAAIVSRPKAYPLTGRSVRRMVLRRFPYSLLYSMQAQGIRILAVAHHKRRPSYWRGRR